MKKLLLSIMITFVPIACFVGFKKHTTEQTTKVSTTKSLHETKQAYITMLEQQEQEIWKSIEQKHGVTKSNIESLRDNSMAAYMYTVRMNQDEQRRWAKNQTLSKEVVELAHTLLRANGISPSSITLVAWNTSIPAAADDVTIYINERQFLNLTPAEQRFTLNHEIQHIKFKDNSLRYALGQRCGEADPKDDNELNALKRFIEVRADVYAMLHDAQCAQGCAELMEKMISLDGDNDVPPAYPKHSIRLSHAQTLQQAYQVKTV